MKIESNRPIRPGAGPDKSKRKDGGGFSINLPDQESEASATAGVAGPTALSGIEALFALQEVPDPRAQRKRAIARGEDLLDRLEDLRVGLLLGQIGPEKLTQLAHLAREQSASIDDPKLRDVLGEIELRAEVELAKLSRKS